MILESCRIYYQQKCHFGQCTTSASFTCVGLHFLTIHTSLYLGSLFVNPSFSFCFLGFPTTFSPESRINVINVAFYYAPYNNTRNASIVLSWLSGHISCQINTLYPSNTYLYKNVLKHPKNVLTLHSKIVFKHSQNILCYLDSMHSPNELETISFCHISTVFH